MITRSRPGEHVEGALEVGAVLEQLEAGIVRADVSASVCDFLSPSPDTSVSSESRL